MFQTLDDSNAAGWLAGWLIFTHTHTQAGTLMTGVLVVSGCVQIYK